MSRRLALLVAALALTQPSLSFAGVLAHPTKPWVAGASQRLAEPLEVTRAPGRPMELKPALWNRGPVAPPVLLASDTAQDRGAWRDLAAKPSLWRRPAVAQPEAPAAVVASDARCACHRS